MRDVPKDGKTNNLKSLSNENFNLSFKAKVKNESLALSEILLHTAEADRRQIYLAMAYPSLFEYMTKYLGYANGCAQRRIDAARLSYDVPGLIEDLENGDLKMSQVELVQRSLRQAKREAKETDPGYSELSKEVKADLLEALKNKSAKESEVLVAQTLNIEIKQTPKITHQANESVRLELTLNKAQWEKITEMRELLSNSLPNGSNWDEVFEYLADKVIAQKRPKPNTADMKKPKAEAKIKPMSFNKLKVQVLNRDQCCQYQDPNTGKICGSKWKLEVDHIHPRWADGGDALENLRVLCANHNKFVYRNQAGIAKT